MSNNYQKILYRDAVTRQIQKNNKCDAAGAFAHDNHYVYFTGGAVYVGRI